MKKFRLIMGFVVALIGAMVVDEVFMKDDIEHQLNINKIQAVAQAKKDAGLAFDSLYKLSEVEKSLVHAKADFDNAEDLVIKEAEGKGSGQKGVGTITQLKNKKAEERKQDWKTKESHLQSLIFQKEKVVMAAGVEKEKSMKDGLLVRIKALFQMVFSDWLVAIVYLAFTILMFCLEFIVVLVKNCSQETNFERKMKMIEEIGKRRMEMMQQAGSPLVSPDYTMSNALAARAALNRKNGSLLN